MFKLGLDIGSTTIKAVVIDEKNNLITTDYQRHNAKISESIGLILNKISTYLDNTTEISLGITGSIGMGIAKRGSFPFVQEVVAVTHAIKMMNLQVTTMIDIGGEDTKVVFFNECGETTDMRMNGNCAGGTGAFIDQMAIILNEEIDNLNRVALQAQKTHPIASRCGVFSKTDVQNLIAKGVARNEVAASIFHAVAVQTITTLAHGCEIKPPLLFCGGTLTLNSALQKAFLNYLDISESDAIILPEGNLLPAIGAAIAHSEYYMSLNDLKTRLKSLSEKTTFSTKLSPLFSDKDNYRTWLQKFMLENIANVTLPKGYQEAFLGVDSGSTTTKVVLLNEKRQMLFHYYAPNGGKPIEAVTMALQQLATQCQKSGTDLNIVKACATGYGEELIKQAFAMDYGVIETIAHFIAAQEITPQVSFILDIGGQDIKAIYVRNGVINQIEINEACSSGCGSFLESFAQTTGYTTEQFAQIACLAPSPCDLGTRCTVFMNSKVKNALSNGHSIEDVAAGLAYSVVKNCLYKVLRLNDISTLGTHIVVQGGTMKNDAVVRALEIETGAKIFRSEFPELMGAYGCALYALKHNKTSKEKKSLQQWIANAAFKQSNINCNGCENQCLVTLYDFGNKRKFYSGNRCERIFFNTDSTQSKIGENIYPFKTQLIFSQPSSTKVTEKHKIGIPRCLNMYEDFPFWQRLFSESGFIVELSSPSNYTKYEKDAQLVMSDNICFPAKLVHSHITNLVEKKVNRIFLPFVVHSRKNGGENSYNCPIVTGYSEVVKNVQRLPIPMDTPTFSMQNHTLFKKQCVKYLTKLDVSTSVAEKAFRSALQSYEAYEREIATRATEIFANACNNGKLTILLAGRPYHTDSLIQHDISRMIASMNVNIISEDIVRGNEKNLLKEVNFVSQWSYTNRILQAARWCAKQKQEVQFVMMTSFGCGPDAFLIDAVRDILMQAGKSLTLLKLDDINNIGAMRLRIRSLIDSIRLINEKTECGKAIKKINTPPFSRQDRKKTIIIPFFTPFISPLIPAIVNKLGYKFENLPISDEKSVEYGLKYANNEVCYPATLVVGDFIKAFKEGGYNPEQTAVAMTQTGGQCRATNYLPLIKKALVDAGFADVPVISVNFGANIINEQPGFKASWAKILSLALYALLFSDAMAKMYHACAVREKSSGEATRLKDKFLTLGAELIEKNEWKKLLQLTEQAAREFEKATIDKEMKKVGVVGEIYLKFNPFAHKHVLDWLMERGVEVVPPMLTDFFTQFFVNRKTKKKAMINSNFIPDWIFDKTYFYLKKIVHLFDIAGSKFRYYTPFNDIFEEAEEGEKIINMNAQFGEGWLLPAEIATYYKQGVHNVISLQPFGCIANHIIVRGIEKRLKLLFPDLNLLSLDFDSSVSEVNITNRMLLFIDNLK